MNSIKQGTNLECSFGTKESVLQVPQSHGVKLNGENQANIADCVENVNIMSFCMCKRQNSPIPCTPKIVMKWLKGQKNFKIGGEEALSDESIVPCIYGGIIKIKQEK